MDTSEIDRLVREAEEHDAKATRKPWAVAAVKPNEDEVRMEFDDFPQHGYSAWLLLRGRDARFIAAARVGWPACAKALRDMRADVERLTRERDEAYTDACKWREECKDMLPGEWERPSVLRFQVRELKRLLIDPDRLLSDAASRAAVVAYREAVAHSDLAAMRAAIAAAIAEVRKP